MINLIVAYLRIQAIKIIRNNKKFFSIVKIIKEKKTNLQRTTKALVDKILRLAKDNKLFQNKIP